MPQGASNYIAKVFGSTKAGALQTDSTGSNGLIVSGGSGVSSALNVTAATVVKASPGQIVSLSVLVAGAAGAIYDSVSTSGNSAANQIGTIPATVGTYLMAFPALVGIVVAPGASQVVSISYS